MEMWERGKKRKVSASCEKQDVYHNNHRRLNMYMTDAEMLPKITVYTISMSQNLFSISIWNSEFYAGSKLREKCVRGMSFSSKVWEAIP